MSEATQRNKATTGTGIRNDAATSGSSDLTTQGREMVGQAQAQAENLVSTAREQATSQLMTQKSRAAESLITIAGALQAASREVRNQDNNTVVADYIDTAAGQVDQFARALHDQDMYQLLKTTEQFARRQPALFLAASFALGFAGTRFLKSSSQSRGRASGSDEYWQSQNRSGWQSSDSIGPRSGYSGSESRYQSNHGPDGDTRYAGSAGSRSSDSEWQARGGFNSGPEGQ
jgi:hypothetical protein